MSERFEIDAKIALCKYSSFCLLFVVVLFLKSSITLCLRA